jgi:hypothetical protein
MPPNLEDCATANIVSYAFGLVILSDSKLPSMQPLVAKSTFFKAKVFEDFLSMLGFI